MEAQRRRDAATKVIHSAAAVAGAVGFFSPLPGTDAALISPIQAALVLKLTSVYDQRPRGAALKAAGYAAIGQIFGRGSSELLSALLPGVGNVIRSGVAVSVTEAIGWAVVENLEQDAAEQATPARVDDVLGA